MTRWRDVLITLAVLACLLVIVTMEGCAPTGEWTKHDSLYKDWDHAAFSTYEYRDLRAKLKKASDESVRETDALLKRSSKGGWWGDAVKVH